MRKMRARPIADEHRSVGANARPHATPEVRRHTLMASPSPHAIHHALEPARDVQPAVRPERHRCRVHDPRRERLARAAGVTRKIETGACCPRDAAIGDVTGCRRGRRPGLSTWWRPVASGRRHRANVRRRAAVDSRPARAALRARRARETRRACWMRRTRDAGWSPTVHSADWRGCRSRAVRAATPAGTASGGSTRQLRRGRTASGPGHATGGDSGRQRHHASLPRGLRSAGVGLGRRASEFARL